VQRFPQFSCYTNVLIIIAALCVLALLFDFFQYLLSLVEVTLSLNVVESAKKDADVVYEGGHLRTLGNICFAAKLLTTGVAAFWLLSIMLAALTK